MYKLEIPCGNKKRDNSFWAAKILGPDPKYGLQREFLRHNEQSITCKWYDLSDGVYNYTDYFGQHYIVVEGDTAKEIEKSEVLNYIPGGNENEKSNAK